MNRYSAVLGRACSVIRRVRREDMKRKREKKKKLADEMKMTEEREAKKGHKMERK